MVITSLGVTMQLMQQTLKLKLQKLHKSQLLNNLQLNKLKLQLQQNKNQTMLRLLK